MSFLRPTAAFRTTALRPAFSAAPRVGRQTRFVQGYGDGKGNPASEEPQKQGKNPKADLEHPGPPPPKVAQGKSSSSPDEPESGAQSSQSQSQPSSSNKSEGSGSSKKGAPQPKILNESLPEPDEGVRKHNKEMEHRAERADSQASNKPEKDDAVSKSFWAGAGGRDREA